MLTEMNFMIGLVLKNDITCKTLSFMLAAMTLAAIAFLCNFYFNNTRIIVPSLLVFCTFTCVIANMSNCDVDIPQALWTVLALISLEAHILNKKNGYLIIAAVLAGMAVQTKIFGVFAVPVLLMRYFLHQKKSIYSTQGIAGVLILCGVPFIMGLPWYIKSYIYNGTILSISHSSIVGQGLSNPMGIECSSGLCYWFVNAILRIISAPWTFSVFPGQHCGDTIGPLFIAVLPFLFFIKKPLQAKIVLILICTFLAEILFMEIWFIQAGTTIRYSMFVLVTGSPLIAWTVIKLGAFPKVQKMLYVMMTIVICLGSMLFIKRYHKEWVALLTFQSRDEYYRSVLPEYPVIETINSLPEGTVVMPVYNYTDYLLEVPYITAHRLHSTPDEMKNDFREKNIGYIFANDKLDPSKNRTTFGEVTDKVCIDSTNGYYLFKLDMQ
jgi:4-amino-4-deoxy-L-arabinose transferase-like glycosyltransferase